MFYDVCMFYEPILEAYLYINIGLWQRLCVYMVIANNYTVKKKHPGKKMATKSQDLVTKIFGLVTSWGLTKTDNFEPWLWDLC